MRRIIQILFLFALLSGCIQPSQGHIETPKEVTMEQPPVVESEQEAEPVDTQEYAESADNASIQVANRQPKGCSRG